MDVESHLFISNLVGDSAPLEQKNGASGKKWRIEAAAKNTPTRRGQIVIARRSESDTVPFPAVFADDKCELRQDGARTGRHVAPQGGAAGTAARRAAPPTPVRRHTPARAGDTHLRGVRSEGEGDSEREGKSGRSGCAAAHPVSSEDRYGLGFVEYRLHHHR